MTPSARRRAGSPAAISLRRVSAAPVIITTTVILSAALGQDTRPALPRFVDVSPGVFSRALGGSSTAGQVIGLTKTGSTVYAATPRAGLWRSVDAGVSWDQVVFTREQAHAGTALPGPLVVEVTSDPGDAKRVLAVSYRNDTYRRSPVDGVYVSSDGGSNWRRKWQPAPCPAASPVSWGAEGVLFVTSALAIAWGGCEVAYSTDRGETWHARRLAGPVLQMIANPSGTAYACGSNPAANPPANFWFARDLTAPWSPLPVGALPAGALVPQEQWCGGYVIQTKGGFRRSLAINPNNPNILYMASYVDDPGRSGVWKIVNNSATRLPTPTDASLGTASGAVYIAAHPHAARPGGLLVFGNADRTFIADGEPSSASDWALIADSRVHVDTRSIYIEPDFDLRLVRAQNGSVYPTECRGRIYLGTDGGVYSSADCGQSWEGSFGGAAIYYADKGTPRRVGGLSTLYPLMLGMAPNPNGVPTLAIGTGDNDDFFSDSGGSVWNVPFGMNCGDCGDWFADILNPTWVMTTGRAGAGTAIRVYPSRSCPADPALPPWQCPQVSDMYPKNMLDIAPGNATAPYRPVIQATYDDIAAGPVTPQVAFITGDAPGPGAGCFATAPRLIRAQLSVTSKPDLSTATVVATKLPPGSYAVQASGGHRNTSYFTWSCSGALDSRDPAGNTRRLVPLPPGSDGTTTGATAAFRYFVNPYDPADLYIVEATGPTPGVKKWSSALNNWVLDRSLTEAATVANHFTLDCQSFPSCLINDMVFVPSETTRFAAGKGGVFYSLDGITWRSLFTTLEMPSVPSSLAFDKYSKGNPRALYVSMNGRGVIRFDNVATPDVIR